MKYDLVKISTSDGLYLHGLYNQPVKSGKCLLLVHGYGANFYESDRICEISSTLQSSDVGFLSVNTRGNGLATKICTTNGNSKVIGSSYELLEEAYMDIDAWVKFLIDHNIHNIALMGHSLGTMKSVRYLFEGDYADKISKLILLAPFDKKAMMTHLLKAEIKGLIEKAKKAIASGKGLDINTKILGGRRISYQTLMSWFKQDELGRMFEFSTKNYTFPILSKINVPTLILVGSKDPYFHPSNPSNFQEAMDILIKHIPDAKGKIIQEADHSFTGFEDILANEISSFLS